MDRIRSSDQPGKDPGFRLRIDQDRSTLTEEKMKTGTRTIREANGPALPRKRRAIWTKALMGCLAAAAMFAMGCEEPVLILELNHLNAEIMKVPIFGLKSFARLLGG